MKTGDRKILLGVLLLGLLGALWFMVLSPKRAEIATLDEDIETLAASVAEQEQLVASALQAKENYDAAYHRLVVLGKAVPDDADTPSLITQITGIADEAGVDFRTLTLSQGAVATPPAPATPAEPAEGEAPAEEEAPAEGQDAAAPVDPVAATEAAAAALPIGATVGPAGLPVMPYELGFRGDFFEIADFMARLDSLVSSNPSVPGKIGVDGRLFTVGGFTLEGDTAAGFPMLSVKMSVMSYVAPPDQGITGGATAAAPVPVSETDTVAATPTASTVAP